MNNMKKHTVNPTEYKNALIKAMQDGWQFDKKTQQFRKEWDFEDWGIIAETRTKTSLVSNYLDLR